MINIIVIARGGNIEFVAIIRIGSDIDSVDSIGKLASRLGGDSKRQAVGGSDGDVVIGGIVGNSNGRSVAGLDGGESAGGDIGAKECKKPKCESLVILGSENKVLINCKPPVCVAMLMHTTSLALYLILSLGAVYGGI